MVGGDGERRLWISITTGSWISSCPAVIDTINNNNNDNNLYLYSLLLKNKLWQ